MVSKWQACGQPAAGPGSFVAAIATVSSKRGSPMPTRSWSPRMQCRRYGARWPPLRRLRPMPRGRRCRVCSGPRRSWRLTWCLSWWRSLRSSWRQSWWRWRPSLSRLQCLILAFTLADAAIIAERADLVWAMPQTASFYATLGLPVNLRSVHFARLSATAERHDGEPVLIVNGEISNSTTENADVPHLRFAIRNAEHQEIYSWTAAPARGRLSAGHKLAFHSELALPPSDTRDVVVRFIDRKNTF